MIQHISPYILFPLVAIVSFVVSVYAVRKVIFITRKRKIYDIPDNIRKIHGAQIPSFGGVGVFAGYIICAAYFLAPDWYVVIISSTILFFTGIYDDLMNMRPVKKLAAQLLASLVSIGFLFTFTPVLPDIGNGGLLLVSILVLAATIACTFFINAFNFIDGIDGLASTMALFYTVVLSGLFWLIHANNLVCVLLSLGGATAGLLLFNRPPAKIYMGDTGSMLLGFNLFMFSLLFLCMYDWAGIFTPVAGVIHTRSGAAVILASMLFIPAFDAVRVFIIRMSRRQSPLKADRSHLHYHLLDVGLSHGQAVMVIVGTNIVLLALGYLLQDVLLPIAVAALCLPCFALLYIVSRLRKRQNGKPG